MYLVQGKYLSIICQRVIQLLVWDSSHLFWFFHTYLKHLLLKFLWMDQISVSGSNICEWIRIFLSHFCVYRHANLCSGLSPQLIKKEIAFLGILPRKWHQLRFEPAALTDHEHLNWVWRSTNYAMCQLMKTLLLWKNIKLVLCIKRSYKGQNGPLKGYKIHYTLANERHIRPYINRNTCEWIWKIQLWTSYSREMVAFFKAKWPLLVVFCSLVTLVNKIQLVKAI